MVSGLYAIVDVGALAARGLPIAETAYAIIDAAPAAVQLRAKEATPRETLALLRAMAPRCRNAGVLLFANDRPDLAVLAGCDGVHVGQDDLPLGTIRRIAPMLRVGVSTHTLDQVDEAARGRPDYIAFGPIFATRSKAKPDPTVGLDALFAATLRSPVPVVAIGGIDADSARAVAERAPALAMIGALLPDDARADRLDLVTDRVRTLKNILSRTACKVPDLGASRPS